MFALVAAAHKKVTFFPTFARDARYINAPGNLSVTISMIIERFIKTILMNLHFLTSSSKFLPYFPAKRIPPSWPIPSFKTHV